MPYNPETEELTVLEEDIAASPVLMLYNDDVNTFDHVIDSLIEVCNHDTLQAEQVALIVHTKGKCDVKRGPIPVLEKMHHQLLERELTVKIIS